MGRKPPVGRGTRPSWKEKEKEDHHPQRRSSTWIFLIVIAGAFFGLNIFFFGSLMEGGRRGPDGRRRRVYIDGVGDFEGPGGMVLERGEMIYATLLTFEFCE